MAKSKKINIDQKEIEKILENHDNIVDATEMLNPSKWELPTFMCKTFEGWELPAFMIKD